MINNTTVLYIHTHTHGIHVNRISIKSTCGGNDPAPRPDIARYQKYTQHHHRYRIHACTVRRSDGSDRPCPWPLQSVSPTVVRH